MTFLFLKSLWPSLQLPGGKTRLQAEDSAGPEPALLSPLFRTASRTDPSLQAVG